MYRPIASDVIMRARDDIRHIGESNSVIACVFCAAKMVICAIVGCFNKSERVQSISFYRLPAVISHQGDRAK